MEPYRTKVSKQGLTSPTEDKTAPDIILKRSSQSAWFIDETNKARQKRSAESPISAEREILDEMSIESLRNTFSIYN